MRTRNLPNGKMLPDEKEIYLSNKEMWKILQSILESMTDKQGSIDFNQVLMASPFVQECEKQYHFVHEKLDKTLLVYSTLESDLRTFLSDNKTDNIVSHL